MSLGIANYIHCPVNAVHVLKARQGYDEGFIFPDEIYEEALRSGKVSYITLGLIFLQAVGVIMDRVTVLVVSLLPAVVTASSPLQSLLIKLHRVLFLSNKSIDITK